MTYSICAVACWPANEEVAEWRSAAAAGTLTAASTTHPHTAQEASGGLLTDAAEYPGHTT